MVEAINTDIAGVFAGAVLGAPKVSEDCSALMLMVFTTQALFRRQKRIPSRCVHYILSRDPVALTIFGANFNVAAARVHLLDGNHLDQIAQQLYITSSTVQDHIKSMLDKTGSRNRSELIARVLGWESTPSARKAKESR